MRLESVDGVTNLFDLNCTGKRCLLGIVALKLETAYVRRLGFVG